MVPPVSNNNLLALRIFQLQTNDKPQVLQFAKNKRTRHHIQSFDMGLCLLSRRLHFGVPTTTISRESNLSSSMTKIRGKTLRGRRPVHLSANNFALKDRRFVKIRCAMKYFFVDYHEKALGNLFSNTVVVTHFTNFLDERIIACMDERKRTLTRGSQMTSELLKRQIYCNQTVCLLVFFCLCR